MNIFYSPEYFTVLYKKILFTKQLKYSVIFDLIVKVFYFLNIANPKKIIITGPQMRMYHLIKTFKNKKNISFNKHRYDNYYLIQFDKYGEKVLNKILESPNPNLKILVGPLYGYEDDIKLNEYMNKHNFIKKIVASESGLEIQGKYENKVNEKDIIVCPSGIISSSDIMDKIQSKESKYDCLIYFKKRNLEELNKIINFLEKRTLSYRVLKYGEYKQGDLSRFSMESKFGIIINKTESQGFAIQEMMANNLPLMVWDYQVNNYQGFVLNGTSVPWWDDEKCGMKVNSYDEFINKFDIFTSRLDEFAPASFIKNNLTYEIFFEKVIGIFEESSIWSN